jgi:hypothetical protein
MQIINVIEVSNGIIEKITSFCFNKKYYEDEKVKEAEKYFIECVKSHRSEHDDLEEDVTDNEILEEDSFNNKTGYEVSIIWSHDVISSISVSCEY